jgi:hypothetical protein
MLVMESICPYQCTFQAYHNYYPHCYLFPLHTRWPGPNHLTVQDVMKNEHWMRVGV